MTILEYGRTEVGMALGGLQNGNRIGWTHDQEKASSLMAVGATVIAVKQSGWIGYEVSFREGRLLPLFRAALACSLP